SRPSTPTRSWPSGTERWASSGPSWQAVRRRPTPSCVSGSPHRSRAPAVPEPLWVGIAEVKPANPDVFGGAEGAYVWAVASAGSGDEFRELLATALEAQDVELTEVEEVEPLLDRSERSPLTRELAELAVEAARSRETAVGTFHVYESEDEEEAEGDATAV